MESSFIGLSLTNSGIYAIAMSFCLSVRSSVASEICEVIRYVAAPGGERRLFVSLPIDLFDTSYPQGRQGGGGIRGGGAPSEISASPLSPPHLRKFSAKVIKLRIAKQR